ncbi:MAG: Na(+)-translocating NADH-quinone reductase subunit C [Chrysiogenales bacterium]|nr:MAG: Na(+)-translocating NADH-quinone reductase subunit C [Chrysiogenales bacterium]
MKKDSIKRTVLVALALCVVCSILVSTAVVVLRPQQDENRRIEQLKNILIAAGLYTQDSEVIGRYNETIRRIMIKLSSGQKAEAEVVAAGLSPERYDIKEAAQKTPSSESIAATDDLAGIKRRPKWINVYLIVDAGQVRGVVLPVFGKGLWSTMYGFIALDIDLKTVSGFSFYEHGETPGLGGEVDNPRWKALWPGKLLYDESNDYRLKVIKGKVDASKPEQKLYMVDGLSGATLTTRGVDNLLRYWLGEKGYAPFFARLRQGEFNEQ